MKQPKFHDALILKGSDLVRFPHDKDSQAFSQKPQKVDPLSEDAAVQGYRKVKNLLESQESYMTVATLPLREEPEASAFSCFAFNPNRLSHVPGGEDLTVVTKSDPEAAAGNANAYQFEFTGGGPDSYKEPSPKSADALDSVLGDGTRFRMAIGRLPKAAGAGSSTLVFNASRLAFHNPWTQEPLFSARVRAVPAAAVVPAQQLIIQCHGNLKILTLDGGAVPLLSQPDQALLTNAQAALAQGTLLGDVASGATTMRFVDLDGLGVKESRVVFATDPGTLLDVDMKQGTVKTLTANDPDYLETWSLLRNGCIAGGVKHGDNASVPIINLSAWLDNQAARPSIRRFAGTHDFKWKPGAALRYVVQRPDGMTDSEFASIVNTIETTVKQWSDTGARISAFQVLEEAVKGPEDYDIWIDLNPLPQTKDDASIQLTDSSLGRYARRKGYRVPTMHLGLIAGFKDPQSPNGGVLTEATYWTSPVFVHTVLHEFGHAFGLPHLHQYHGVRQELQNRTGNPNLFAKDAAQINVAIKQELGIDVSEGVIREELLEELQVEDAFSDWPDGSLRTTTAKPAIELADKSVMIGLGLRTILTGFRDGDPKVNFEIELGEIDKAWILQLYPPLQVPGDAGQTQDLGDPP